MKNFMERDSRGRFLRMRYPEIEAAIASENEQAQKIVKVCDSIGIRPEDFDVKQLESGNRRVDYRALIRLSGIALGLALALNKPTEKTRDLLLLVGDALGWQLQKEEHLENEKRSESELRGTVR